MGARRQGQSLGSDRWQSDTLHQVSLVFGYLLIFIPSVFFCTRASALRHIHNSIIASDVENLLVIVAKFLAIACPVWGGVESTQVDSNPELNLQVHACAQPRPQSVPPIGLLLRLPPSIDTMSSNPIPVFVKTGRPF